MWKAAQIAVQGKSHIDAGIPCQDKTYVLKAENFLAAGLADGAGSASRSEIGAQCVTQTICRLLNENFDRYFANENAAEVAIELLEKLLDALKITADKEFCTIDDLDSTLLAVAVNGDNFITAHIGDGVIGALRDENLIVISNPDNGEFINETFFVTSRNAINHFRLDKGNIGDISAFILMSDGTAAGMYARNTQSLNPILNRLIDATKILPVSEVEDQLDKSFQDSLCKITADDCSLIIMVDIQ